MAKKTHGHNHEGKTESFTPALISGFPIVQATSAEFNEGFLTPSSSSLASPSSPTEFEADTSFSSPISDSVDMDMVQESSVEIEGVVAVDSSSPPYLDAATLDSTSLSSICDSHTMQASSLSFFADQELEFPEWKPKVEAFNFGTFDNGFSDFDKEGTPIVKVVDSDFVLHSHLLVSFAVDERVYEKTYDNLHFSFFADRRLHVPPGKPATDPFIFGTFNKDFLDPSPFSALQPLEFVAIHTCAPIKDTQVSWW